jgi:hypothetical protein
VLGVQNFKVITVQNLKHCVKNNIFSKHTPPPKMSTVWQQLGQDIDGAAAGDLSGYSVSMNADGTRVAIGAINNNGYRGHVRVYE